MIELSPQITTAVPAPESQDAGAVRQDAVKEKDDENTFSKLLAGLLKKMKTASGKEAESAEQSEKTNILEKASFLSVLKAKKGEDENRGNEELAALFFRSENVTRDYLPRKSELSFGNEENFAAEKISSEAGELKLEEPGDTRNLLSEKNDAEHVDGEQTEKNSSAELLADVSRKNVLQTELAAENANSVEGETPENIGFVDALRAENKNALPDESAVNEMLLSSQAKSALVDADASSITIDEKEKAENESGGKIKDKRKERFSLETAEGRINASPENSQAEMHHGNDGNFSAEKIDADIVVELRDGRNRSEERGAARETSNAQTFQDMLSRELHNGLNTEIVRHASIVLRESGEGLIRLSLRPENLGNIKIRLEMADNKVTGKIVLETDEALKAFEKEIASLEQSFRDSGFDGASLEMSLASDQGNNGAGQQWKGEEARPFFSERFVSSRYEIPINYDGMPESAGGRNLSLVDIMA